MNDTKPEKPKYLVYYVPMVGLKTTQGHASNSLMRVLLNLAVKRFGGCIIPGNNFIVGVFNPGMPKGSITEFEQKVASKVYLYDLDERGKAEKAEARMLELIEENPDCFGEIVIQSYLNNMQYVVRGAEWLITEID